MPGCRGLDVGFVKIWVQLARVYLSTSSTSSLFCDPFHLWSCSANNSAFPDGAWPEGCLVRRRDPANAAAPPTDSKIWNTGSREGASTQEGKKEAMRGGERSQIECEKARAHGERRERESERE
jgi:hypothetical protein